MAKITQAEGAAPGTPASGYSSIYVGTDGLWYSVDDLGNTYRLSMPYAEGSWTPAFAGSTGAGTYTYTIQVGRYTRIGNVVFIRGRITISAISVAPTGTMLITGLPFSSANVTNLFGSVAFGYINNFNKAASAIELTGFIGPATTQIDLYEAFDNAAAVGVPAASFGASTDLIFTGQYQV